MISIQTSSAPQFARAHQILCDYGSLTGSRPRSVRTPVIEESVLDAVETNPNTSIGAVVSACVSFQCTASFAYRDLASLSSPKSPITVPRWSSCTWTFRAGISPKSAKDVYFPAYVLVTDECIFSPDEVFNQHDEHLLAHENPQGMYGIMDTILLRIKCVGMYGGRLLSRVVIFHHLAWPPQSIWSFGIGSTRLTWGCSSKCEMQHGVPTRWGATPLCFSRIDGLDVLDRELREENRSLHEGHCMTRLWSLKGISWQDSSALSLQSNKLPVCSTVSGNLCSISVTHTLRLLVENSSICCNIMNGIHLTRHLF